MSFTQLWRWGTFNAAVPLNLSPVGEKWLLSQTKRGQGLLIPHVICTEACSSCAVLIPCFPLTSAYSPVIPSPVRLSCVTLPPPVREPLGTSCWPKCCCVCWCPRRHEIKGGKKRTDKMRARVRLKGKKEVYGGEKEKERDLRAHPALIKEPSP